MADKTSIEWTDATWSPLRVRVKQDAAAVARAPENRATFCCRCHKAVDYSTWAPKFRAWLEAERERRIEEKDAQRPILKMLKEAV